MNGKLVLVVRDRLPPGRRRRGYQAKECRQAHRDASSRRLGVACSEGCAIQLRPPRPSTEALGRKARRTPRRSLSRGRHLPPRGRRPRQAQRPSSTWAPRFLADSASSGGPALSSSGRALMTFQEHRRGGTTLPSYLRGGGPHDGQSQYVRNRATVGGNVCADKSCSSLIPILPRPGSPREGRRGNRLLDELGARRSFECMKTRSVLARRPPRGDRRPT